MISKLDHSKISLVQDSNLSMTYCAFLYVHGALSSGGDVESLKLVHEEEVKVKEKGFREFLNRIASLPFNEEVLSESEKASLDTVREYLATPIMGEPEPYNSSEDAGIQARIDAALGGNT